MLSRLPLALGLFFALNACSQTVEPTPSPALTTEGSSAPPAPQVDARVAHPESAAIVERALTEYAKPHEGDWSMKLDLEQRLRSLSQDFKAKLKYTSDDSFTLRGEYVSIMGGFPEPVVMQMLMTANDGKFTMESQVENEPPDPSTFDIQEARDMMASQGVLGNPMGNAIAPGRGLKRLLDAFTWHSIEREESVIRMLGRPADAVYEFFMKQRFTPSPASAWVEFDATTGWPLRLEMISSKDEVLLGAAWSRDS